MRPALMLAAAAALMAGPALAAGVLRAPVLTSGTYAGQLPSATVTSGELNLTPRADSQWTFAFKDAAAYMAPLTISVVSGLQTHSGSNLTFDVPYYREGPLEWRMGAALAGDVASDGGIRRFVSQASAHNEPAELILLNQRARRLWDVRSQNFGAVAPIAQDARLAFWLLQSSATLVTSQMLSVDPSTRKAMAWMRAALGDPDLVSADGRNGTVVRSQAEAVLSTLNGRDAFVYTKIVNRLGEDLGSGVPARQKAACARAQRLAEYYDAAEQADSPLYPNWKVQQLVVRKNVALCKTRAIQSTARSGGNISATELSSAAALSSELTSLANAVAADTGSGVIVRQALGAAADLAAVAR